VARVSKVEGHKRQIVDGLRAEGLLVTEWSDAPNVSYDSHTHLHREVRVVLTGAMSFVVGSSTFPLGPGDRIDLAPGEIHSARVGPSGVTYLAGRQR
jgi:mannose-6-phosphate isomerase-like protein (cupin superfamily)